MNQRVSRHGGSCRVVASSMCRMDTSVTQLEKIYLDNAGAVWYS